MYLKNETVLTPNPKEKVRPNSNMNKLLRKIPLLKSLYTSYSQHGQDRWVIDRVFKNKKHGGYFLEMGAADGILLSNTYLLEKKFGWNGILVEPTHKFEQLKVNRNAHCDNSCIAALKKTVYVVEIPGPAHVSQQRDNTLRSMTIDADTEEEAYKLALGRLPENLKSSLGNINFNIKKKSSITLADLLEKYDAPSQIDYFSLDVEGYEYEILKNFPFDRYIFHCMTIERPSTMLRKLLEQTGYIAVGRNDVGDIYYIHSSMYDPSQKY